MSAALRGRRILITGAAAGIGLATAHRFLTEGAAVAALDRDAAALGRLKAAVPGRTLTVFQADVTDADGVAQAVNDASRALGGIDGLVNAAGIDLVADIEAMAFADWNRILAVNLTGPMLMMQAAYPHLKAAGGSTIVNVSSAAGLAPLGNRMAYCASKAGLQMAGKALAIEAAAFGIRVNTVCPGAVETGLLRAGIDAAPDPAAAYEAVRARSPRRRKSPLRSSG